MGATQTESTIPIWAAIAGKLALYLSIAVSLFTASVSGQDQDAPAASVSEIARDEVLRRQQMLARANQLIQAGAMAQTDRSYGEAMDNFRAAFELMPEAPAVAATRRAVFRRYQSATVQYAQQMIDEARWPQAKSVLEEAVALGSEAGLGSSMDPGLKRMLVNLNDPDYYAQAIGPQHIENVQKVKQLLITAQGYLDYGDYDRALKTYNRVLSIDRYNSAARRGMENVERHMLNYYDVARDQTRATQLRKVAQEWEMAVPPTSSAEAFTLPADATAKGRRETLEEKLKTIIIPSLEFDQVPLVDVLELLNQRSVALDFAEADPTLKGINLVLDVGSFGAGDSPGQRPLTLKLSNIPLGVALRYVTQLTGTAYRVDNFAVRIVSTAAAAQKVMENRTWVVPPGFLNREGLGNDIQLNADPFADVGADQGVAGSVLVKRKTAKEYLTENGITFEEGSLATYNPATSTLLVRNTPDQLALIDNLVQSAREGVSKMVEVGLKMISITQEKARQIGVDTLLGQSNLGSSPRVFAGGGTTGANTQRSVTFTNPGTNTPVGVFPLSSGLRLGDFQGAQTIDDVISSLQDTTNDGAAVFSVAGVFTDPQFQATLRLFNQTKGIDFLCDTKLLIRPGLRGKVEIQREFIYPTEYDPPELPNSIGVFTVGNVRITSPTNDLPVVPAQPTAFEMRPIGKVIEVEPTVSDNNKTVSIDLLLDFTDFSGFINYGSPIRNPNIAQLNATGNAELALATANRILMPVFDTIREATSVTVWDGQTIAIGGFYGHSVTDTQDKIPFLGDLPAIGQMFRTATEDHTKRGIIIFASVRLIDPGGIPLNGTITEDEANEFPPTSGNPPYAPPPAFAAPAMPYQK